MPKPGTMAHMFEPRPWAKYLPPDLDAQDAAFVRAWLGHFDRLRAGRDMRLRRALPSGGSVQIIDMGGVRKIIVTPAPKEAAEISPGAGKAHLHIPMLFSGRVLKSTVEHGEGVPIQLSQTCARRLTQYTASGPGTVTLQRFAIEAGPRHQEFTNDKIPRLFTQYAQLRPGWFSGRMSSAVQVALGYGRQDFAQLPDNAIERADLLLPEAVQKAAAGELGDAILPACTGWPVESGQIQYQYKFLETHGVAFASGQPWLIRISAAGVFAMPLPMVPASTTAAFAQYIQGKGDSEIEWLLEHFGGMPSGEAFPQEAQAFEAWQRAGVILQLCAPDQMQDFYAANGYSSAMGWSFNQAGMQAVNTCWRFGEDGIQRGSMWRVSLNLGNAQEWGRARAPDGLPPKAMGYIAKVRSGLGHSARDLALQHKLLRAPLQTLLDRADAGGNAQAEQAWWDAHQAASIASGSGNIHQVHEGKLWAPGQPKQHPQIKFPEPVGAEQGCISHDFGRLEGTPPPDPQPRCDTIMHAWFVDNDLKVAKYFRDPRSVDASEENDFDECMQVGQWQQTITHTSSTICGHFYTSDFDERKTMAEVETLTQITGTDLGFESVPNFAFNHFFATNGMLWRNRYFQHDTHSTKTEGQTMTVALCVPFFAPHSILHAHKWGFSGATTLESRHIYHATDPHSYRYYTYDFIWAWVGGAGGGNAVAFSPWPKEGQPVWVIEHFYAPGPCSDFADAGDWMGPLPQDYTWLIHPDKNTWNHSGGGSPPKTKPYSHSTAEDAKEGGDLKISIVEAAHTISTEKPSERYFLMSPDPYVGVFWRDAMRNEAGAAEYANCSEEESPGSPLRWHVGQTVLADHKGNHAFIGVINN